MPQVKKSTLRLVPLLLAAALAPGCKAQTRAPSNTPITNAANAVAAVLLPTGTMSAARSSHTATLLPDGRVLIAGGMERNGIFFDSAEVYDPVRGTFTPTRHPMNTARAGHTATPLPGGKVLLAGGYGAGGALASAELYDPAAGKFAPTGGMTVRRGDFTATLLPDGKVLVAGGENGGFLADAELYDPAAGKFAPTGRMSSARTMHAATLLPNGKVLVTGGGAYRQPLASAELYDQKSGRFAPTGQMRDARYKHATVLLPGGGVLVVGGSDGRDWQGRLAGAELYDPARAAFTALGDMNAARFKLPDAVALLQNGAVFIAGGDQTPEIYDPKSKAFRRVAARFDDARFYSTATTLPDGSVLIVGGYNAHGSASARAWRYRA